VTRGDASTQKDEEAVAEEQDVGRPEVEQGVVAQVSQLENESWYEGQSGEGALRDDAHDEGRAEDEQNGEHLGSEVERQSRLAEQQVRQSQQIEERRPWVSKSLGMGSRPLRALEHSAHVDLEDGVVSGTVWNAQCRDELSQLMPLE
jgi:hypothetical protein